MVSNSRAYHTYAAAYNAVTGSEAEAWQAVLTASC